jgi:hypothetical protein
MRRKWKYELDMGYGGFEPLIERQPDECGSVWSVMMPEPPCRKLMDIPTASGGIGLRHEP